MAVFHDFQGITLSVLAEIANLMLRIAQYFIKIDIRHNGQVYYNQLILQTPSIVNQATVEYVFDNELIEVYEEYLMYDIIGLIGTVGGTLGLFIGFSFFDVSSTIIQYIFSYNRN